MPHEASALAKSWIATPGDIATFVLSTLQASDFSAALSRDSAGLVYSSCVTLLDALRGLGHGYFTWATVKLYYVSFYAARSVLGLNSLGICYLVKPSGGGVEFSLRAFAGESAQKQRGATHKAVWKLYRQELPSSSLLAPVGIEPAPDWLMRLREEANYKNPRFPEPIVPAHFRVADDESISRVFEAYVQDSAGLYTFDPDHACLAFPVACLRQAVNSMRNAGLSLDSSSWNYIKDQALSIGMSNQFTELLQEVV